MAIYIKSLKNVDSPDSVIPPLGKSSEMQPKKWMLIAVLVIMVKKKEKKNREDSTGTQLSNL